MTTRYTQAQIADARNGRRKVFGCSKRVLFSLWLVVARSVQCVSVRLGVEASQFFTLNVRWAFVSFTVEKYCPLVLRVNQDRIKCRNLKLLTIQWKWQTERWQRDFARVQAGRRMLLSSRFDRLEDSWEKIVREGCFETHTLLFHSRWASFYRGSSQLNSSRNEIMHLTL